jgi:hypothetical protein
MPSPTGASVESIEQPWVYGDLAQAVRLSGQRKGEWRGTLAILSWRIERGAGVFYSVQALDGEGSGAANVCRIRGFHADGDSDGQRQSLRCFIACSGLWPTILTATGGLTASGKPKVQAIWLVDDCPVEAFAAIQLQLLERTGTDPAARDLARIFRLPGFWHVKHRGAPRMTRMLAMDGGHYSLADFTARMQAAPKQQEIRPASGSRSALGGGNAVGGARRNSRGCYPATTRLRALIDAHDGMIRPAVTALITEIGAAGAGRHDALVSVTGLLVHKRWVNQQITAFLTPLVNQHFHDGDWSVEVERAVAHARDRTAMRRAAQLDSQSSPTNSSAEATR